MTCSILVGGAWGDEGKGKCITYLCSNDKPSIIARAGVGPNAGHSVEFNGEKYGLRLTPSGFVHTDAKLMIGAGVLVNPDVLYKEFDDLAKYNVKERMSIDSRCAIITEDHMDRDKSSEHLAKKIGSTGSGCGPANSDRVMRTINLARDYPELEEYITDVSLEVNEAINDGEEVFIEGSQGFALSLYYGTYPFVTSKDTTASTLTHFIIWMPISIRMHCASRSMQKMSSVRSVPSSTAIPSGKIPIMSISVTGGTVPTTIWHMS